MWHPNKDQQTDHRPRLIRSTIISATPLTLIEQQPPLPGLNGKTTCSTIVTPPEATAGRAVAQAEVKRGFCRRGGNRLVHPRLSLWGKPMQTRQRHRDPRYRKLRFQVNNFLERPRGWKAIFYHMIV
ncbi:hypothetical protein JTE90_028135 [Oedothorax gibbosus]|uniref:Uncharacterized protein n=1 Tax=Oedothorax gibbosus TaxID=931172 RepID=A0AAV6V8R7_9ARAC|nr:hypothetical protein JTE90_028135 [Oedothorax gibbosus]